MKKIMRTVKLVIISISIVAIILAIKQAKDNNQLQQKLIEYELNYNLLTDSIYQLTQLTEDNILFWCNYFDVKYPRVVLAQIKLETGHFTSDLCLIANNLIGMKHPNVRKTTAIYTTVSGYAGYSSYIDNIKDIRLWQEYYCVDTISSEQSYIKWAVSKNFF